MSSWVNDLRLRLIFTKRWIELGTCKTFWISGFFYTQGFLTGLLQTHARKYDLPIDHLSFKFTVIDRYRDQATYQEILGNYDHNCIVQYLNFRFKRWNMRRRRWNRRSRRWRARSRNLHGCVEVGRQRNVHDRKRPRNYEYPGTNFQDGARNGLLAGQVWIHLPTLQGRTATGCPVDHWPLDEFRCSNASSDEGKARALDQQGRRSALPACWLTIE